MTWVGRVSPRPSAKAISLLLGVFWERLPIISPSTNVSSGVQKSIRENVSAWQKFPHACHSSIHASPLKNVLRKGTKPRIPGFSWQVTPRFPLAISLLPQIRDSVVWDLSASWKQTWMDESNPCILWGISVPCFRWDLGCLSTLHKVPSLRFHA